MDRLTRAVGPGYDAELVSRGDPSTVIYQSAPDAHVRIDSSTSDAQVGLFDVRPRIPPPPDRPREGGSPEHAPPSRPMMPPPARGRWLLSVRHQAGSLDALVARTRLRNIMVTTAVLVLMLLTIAALVRFTRRAQALSELQMQFVAGVSHELRTPLTVIRTAAHNLTTGIVKTGDVNQVQRYGRLIGSETEKLTAIVEQVLAFANSEAGRAIRKREPVAVESLIQQSLADCGTAIADAQCVVESTIAADVVPLWGDPTALRHALQNLLNNAAKYGAEGHWIGVSAAMAAGPRQQPLVEIRVADRGAGIPADERSQIFDPFYRGRRAIDDQVHGTGLGLALVKRIVEAHGGTIGVEPGPDQRGAEFTVRIPAAPPEELDEFADTTGRR
jgi:signal transduction histidine kinase